MRSIVSLVLTVALIAVGCGDDGDGLGRDEQQLADALALSIGTGSDPDSPFYTPESAQCFAEGLVEGLGVARLAMLGLTAENQSRDAAFAAMTPAERDDLVELALHCTDVQAAMAAELEAAGISSGSAACIADALGNSDFFRDAFVAGFAGREFDPESNPEYTALLLEAATDCLSPDELGPFFGGG